jgi:hypothetical protein
MICTINEITDKSYRCEVLADLSTNTVTQLRLQKLDDGTVLYFAGHRHEALRSTHFGRVGDLPDFAVGDENGVLELTNPVKAALVYLPP